MSNLNIQTSITPGVAVVTIDRPKHKNALDQATIIELTQAIEMVGIEYPEHLLVLRGTGSTFSVGFDLKAIAPIIMNLDAADDADLKSIAQAGQALIETLRTSPNLTISAIHGHAIGGGFLLAAACDFRIISTQAKCSLPEVDLGLPLTWGGVELLCDTVGINLARRYILTGERITTEHLYEAQFAYAIVEPESFDETVDTLIATLASKPPAARRMIMAQFRRRYIGQGASDETLFVEAVRHKDFLANAVQYVQTKLGSNITS